MTHTFREGQSHGDKRRPWSHSGLGVRWPWLLERTAAAHGPARRPGEALRPRRPHFRAIPRDAGGSLLSPPCSAVPSQLEIYGYGGSRNPTPLPARWSLLCVCQLTYQMETRPARCLQGLIFLHPYLRFPPFPSLKANTPRMSIWYLQFIRLAILHCFFSPER